MKKLYLLIFSSILFISAIAQTAVQNIAQRNGNWSNNSVWSLKHQPQSGEIVVINPGVTITVDGPVNNLSSNILVYGNLVLNKHLRLNVNNAVQLMTTSSTLTSTTKDASQFLEIGGVTKFTGNQTPSVVKGVATASKTTLAAPQGFQIASTLPVVFASFTVAKAANNILIQWSTTEEINADLFQVERSDDGRTWKAVGTVKAVGNSNNINNYAFTDKTLFSNAAYYRIKQVDLDGQFVYTEVKVVTRPANSSNAADIIAAGSNIVVKFSKEVKGTVIIRLISLGGQVMIQQSFSQPSQQIIINRTAVNNGNYIVSVCNNLDLAVAKQVNL